MFRKGFGIKFLNLISKGPFSLGRPKWEGALGPREPKRGGRLGELPGSFPPPPWRLPRQERILGRIPRAAPSSKMALLPIPL